VNEKTSSNGSSRRHVILRLSCYPALSIKAIVVLRQFLHKLKKRTPWGARIFGRGGGMPTSQLFVGIGVARKVAATESFRLRPNQTAVVLPKRDGPIQCVAPFRPNSFGRKWLLQKRKYCIAPSCRCSASDSGSHRSPSYEGDFSRCPRSETVNSCPLRLHRWRGQRQTNLAVYVMG
jgi:hypothetical protein